MLKIVDLAQGRGCSPGVIGVCVGGDRATGYALAFAETTVAVRDAQIRALVFGGCILLVEDCYSYLAKMRQGAEGAWLFHIAYTPEPHSGTLFFLFHLRGSGIIGKRRQLLY